LTAANHISIYQKGQAPFVCLSSHIFPLVFFGTQMAITFSELALNLDQLRMSDARDGPRGIKLRSITYKGSPFKLRLADDLATLRIPFDPSTYNNNPNESRKNVVFSIPHESFNVFAELEDWCRRELECASLWCSSLKPSESYDPLLRAKIHTQGPRSCRYWNKDLESITAPAIIRNVPLNALVHIRGCYESRQGVGLMLEVADLQFGDPPSTTCPF
jgi:hypothetical protein